MRAEQRTETILELLYEAGVEFIVVGGAAAVLLGASIVTQDLDIVHRRTPGNVARLHECDAHRGHARLALAEANLVATREHLLIARRIVEETGYHRRDEELAELEAACR